MVAGELWAITVEAAVLILVSIDEKEILGVYDWNGFNWMESNLSLFSQSSIPHSSHNVDVMLGE